MYFTREKELDAVLATLHHDHAGAVAIVGEPGSGRTTVAEAAAAREGLPRAVVRSSFAETGWEFSGVSAFLAAIDSAHGTSLHSRLQAQRLSGPAFDVARRIEVELREAALESCLLIIDDVDDLDLASQQVLGYIIRRRPSPAVKTLLTMRTPPLGGPFGGIPRVVLNPLDLPSLFEFSRSLAPSTADSAVLELTARLSTGSPLACRSILGEFSDETIAGDAPVPMPLRPGAVLTATLLPLLEPLSEESRRILGIIASAPYLPEDIFAGFENSHVVAAEELVAEGILERGGGMLRTRTPAFGAVAYWSLEAAERIAIHSDLATACEGSFPGLSAWHRSFFAPSKELPDILLDESIELVRSGSHDISLVFTERALGLTGVCVRADLLVNLGEELTDMGDYDQARRLIQFANHPGISDEVRLRIATALVVLDYIQHQTVSRRQISALAGLHAREHPRLCAWILGIAVVFCLDRWELQDARELAEQAASLPAPAAPVSEAIDIVVSWIAAAFSGAQMPDIVELQTEADAVREIFGTETATIMLARALSLGGRFADARELIDGLLEFGTSIDRIWVDFALQVQLNNEYRAGRLHRVRETFDLIEAAPGSHRSSTLNRRLTRAALECADGRIAEATATICETMRLVAHRQGPAQEGLIAMRQGKIAMGSHRFDIAAEHFARARRFSLRLENPQLLGVYGDYVETLLRLGRVEDARAMVEELRVLAQKTPSQWARLVLAVLDAQLLDDDDALAAFSALFEEWDDGEYKYLRARALFSYSERLKRAGYQRRSLEARAEAQNRFHEIGVQGTCRDGEEAGTVHDPIPVFALLDEKESPVVRLLAKGYKNKTIANELFVSVRTVELRLTSVYRKVGVKSRFELMRLVAGQAEMASS